MSNGLFFGVEIKPSTLYSYNVSHQVEFTMATLKNAKNSHQRTVIYMELNNVQFTICSLITEKVEQQVLNLKVQKGAKIKMWSNGPNPIQLLGTYYVDKDTNDKQNNPLEQLSVQTAPIDDNDIIYYPMTKEEHKSLLQYNSEEAVAEREEFIGKFGVVMDILESIEDPQPILDSFLAKYKDSKKRGLEDIERVLTPKKLKKADDKKKQEDDASKANVKKAVMKNNTNPIQNGSIAKKKHNITKPDNKKKQEQDANKKKKEQSVNRKKQAKKNQHNAQKTQAHFKPNSKTTVKKKASKIGIPQ